MDKLKCRPEEGGSWMALIGHLSHFFSTSMSDCDMNAEKFRLYAGGYGGVDDRITFNIDGDRMFIRLQCRIDGFENRVEEIDLLSLCESKHA